MIRYSTDAQEVGGMLERIGTPDAVTTADLLQADNWHAWIWGGGVFVAVDQSPGVAEAHVYVYPSARGIHAVRAAAEFVRAEHDAGVSLIGRTPMNNRPARRFAALCGGRLRGVEDGREVREWAI